MRVFQITTIFTLIIQRFFSKKKRSKNKG